MSARRAIPELVLFDLDGTLAASLEAGLEEINRLRHLFRYDKLDKNDPRLRRVSGMAFARDILRLSPLQLALWLPLVKFLVARRAGDVPLYRGWRATLGALKKRCALGIVTSAPRRYAEGILARGGVRECFSELAADVAYHRKARELSGVLKRRGVAASRAIYVGDEVRDFEASRANGIPFVAVSWGKDDPELFGGRRAGFMGLIAKPSELGRFVGGGA